MNSDGLPFIIYADSEGIWIRDLELVLEELEYLKSIIAIRQLILPKNIDRDEFLAPLYELYEMIKDGSITWEELVEKGWNNIDHSFVNDFLNEIFNNVHKHIQHITPSMENEIKRAFYEHVIEGKEEYLFNIFRIYKKNVYDVARDIKGTELSFTSKKLVFIIYY